MPSIDELKALLALACKSTYLKRHITPVLSQDAGTHPHKLTQTSSCTCRETSGAPCSPGTFAFLANL